MRYLILLVLTAPIVILAFINLLVNYKMRKIPRRHFYRQLVIWFIISTVLICSYPAYNLMNNRPLLDASSLNAFDIVQTAAIIYLFYVVNDHRRKIERAEKAFRDLHQELSIKLGSN